MAFDFLGQCFPPSAAGWYPDGQERSGEGLQALGNGGQPGLSPSYLIVEGAGPSPTHMGELAAMEAETERLDQEPWEPGGQEEDEEGRPAPAYLSQATELITQALRDEKAGAYAAALQGYRDGVHILLQGVPGEYDWKVEGQAWSLGCEGN